MPSVASQTSWVELWPLYVNLQMSFSGTEKEKTFKEKLWDKWYWSKKETNVENSSMISVLANAHAYLTSFLHMDTGDSIGQSDTNVSGGSVYS